MSVFSLKLLLYLAWILKGFLSFLTPSEWILDPGLFQIMFYNLLMFTDMAGLKIWFKRNAMHQPRLGLGLGTSNYGLSTCWGSAGPSSAKAKTTIKLTESLWDLNLIDLKCDNTTMIYRPFLVWRFVRIGAQNYNCYGIIFH